MLKPVQNAGIVFLGAAAPGREIVNQLLPHARVLVAADSGLHTALELGLVPHITVGDMDSVHPDALKKLDQASILRYPTDKDFTDTELAIAEARTRGAERIFLVGGGGGRYDHQLAVQELFKTEQAPDAWYTAHEEIFVIKSSRTFLTQPGEIISFFALSPLCGVYSKGLVWELDGLEWKAGVCSISNRSECAIITVGLRSGSLLCVRNLNAVGACCAAPAF